MIKRALRSKVRPAEQMYLNGDIVLYKRGGKVFFIRVSPRTDCAMLIQLKVMELETHGALSIPERMMLR